MWRVLKTNTKFNFNFIQNESVPESQISNRAILSGQTMLNSAKDRKALSKIILSVVKIDYSNINTATTVKEDGVGTGRLVTNKEGIIL